MDTDDKAFLNIEFVYNFKANGKYTFPLRMKYYIMFKYKFFTLIQLDCNNKNQALIFEISKN